MQSFQFEIPKGMRAVISPDGKIIIKSIRPSRHGFFKVKRIKAKVGVIPMEETLVLQNQGRKKLNVQHRRKKSETGKTSQTKRG